MPIIINADDFGLNENATKAIISAVSKKLITNTTLCANGKCFKKAVSFTKEYQLEEKIGIHINITEGTPLTQNIQNDRFFCNSDGVFHFKEKMNETLSASQKESVKQEISAQIERILKEDIRISHADSHHYIHTIPTLLELMTQIFKKYNITKVRLAKNLPGLPKDELKINRAVNQYYLKNDFFTTDYFGSVAEYQHITLQPDQLYEVMVHPYIYNDILIDKTGGGNAHLKTCLQKFKKEQIIFY